MTALTRGSRGEASREGEPEAPSYVHLTDSSVARTVQLTDNILVDLDCFGRAVGVEYLAGPLSEAMAGEWGEAGERFAAHGYAHR